MKVEIELPGGRASIENDRWSAPPDLLGAVEQADAVAGFVWDPVGGQDYARASAVAVALGGVVITKLSELSPTEPGDDDLIF